MLPAIQAIPTFGICSGVTQPEAGYKPGNAKKVPTSWAARMVRMGRITPIVGVPGGEVS
jgi:hypothetical protein